MTRSKILRSVSPWPMYADELGGNVARLTVMEENGLLKSYSATGGRRLYQITPKGKAWLKLTWWKRLWS